MKLQLPEPASTAFNKKGIDLNKYYFTDINGKPSTIINNSFLKINDNLFLEMTNLNFQPLFVKESELFSSLEGNKFFIKETLYKRLPKVIDILNIESSIDINKEIKKFIIKLKIESL